jgi:hypothetical protein
VNLIKTDYEEGRLQPTHAGHPTFPLSPWYFEEKNLKKFIEIDEKRLRKKVALIKTDYEERRLQPTPAGHPQLATQGRTTFYWFHWSLYQPSTCFTGVDSHPQAATPSPRANRILYWLLIQIHPLFGHRVVGGICEAFN